MGAPPVNPADPGAAGAANGAYLPLGGTGSPHAPPHLPAADADAAFAPRADAPPIDPAGPGAAGATSDAYLADTAPQRADMVWLIVAVPSPGRGPLDLVHDGAGGVFLALSHTEAANATKGITFYGHSPHVSRKAIRAGHLTRRAAICHLWHRAWTTYVAHYSERDVYAAFARHGLQAIPTPGLDPEAAFASMRYYARDDLARACGLGATTAGAAFARGATAIAMT